MVHNDQINMTIAKISDSNIPDTSPLLSSVAACDADTFSGAALTVVFAIVGVVELLVPVVEFVELEACPVKASRTPKYAGFFVTVASIKSPDPVPGKVDSIQEYCLSLAQVIRVDVRANTLSSKSQTVRPTQFFVARHAAAVVL